MITTDEIRQSFLDFFRKKDHQIVKSDSLVPQNDPSLLFTSAGMNQFKEQFMGRQISFRRAASCQKCLRTADLDQVGQSPRHHSFFEMLGNFSFGDYFKEEAISWAWEYLTLSLKIPAEKLWTSVYLEDREAEKTWREKIGLPAKKIIRLSEKENFWPSEAKSKGPNGPCGACSEIYYDRGKKIGCSRKNCRPGCDCERFVEVWNLVFTQFNRKDGGVLEPLPFKNIDTGMGLERIASVMQNTSTNFEIDIFLPFVNAISQALDYRYKSEAQKDVLVRMIADHARAVIFAICDGVFPSNEGRGYVIRKLVRRVSLYSRRFKKQEIFLYKMVSPLARMMSTAYPEIEEKREDIALVIKGEEGRFGEIFRQRIPEVEQCFQTYAREGKKVIAGADIFKFYDTLGVPIELQEEIAAEFALTIDKTALKALLEEQKARSRKGSKIKTEIFHQQGVDWKRSGVGKGQGSKITQIVKDNRLLELAKTGQEVFLLVEGQDALAQFYGEAGGQVGDQGWIYSQDKKAKGRILNTVLKDGHPVFLVKVEQGELAKGAEVSLEVDLARKAKIAKNHTATHLLQSALRKALGTHVLQSGSVVDENHLRFDFTHPKKVEARELERVEDLVNEQIRNRLAVNKEMMSLAEAKKNGAMALFGEKYKDRVRVVSIAGFSKELCGGTHIENTQEIGFFKIISETAVAAGIRRIEALTNQTAAAWVSRERDELLRGLENKIKNLRLKAEKTGDKKLLSGIETQEGKIKKLSGGLAKEICLVEYPEWKKTKALLLEEKEALERLGAEMEKALSKQKIESLKNQIDQWIAQALSIGKTKVIIQKLKDIDSEHLRLLADKLKEKIPSLVFSLVSTNAEGKISFLLGASTDLVTKGFDAVKIAKEVTSIVGGSGGGRKDLAQAGGKDIHKLDAALAQFKILIEGLLK